MNKQEPTAEQEEPEYTVEKPRYFWPMITTADGRNITSIQEFADELNELVRQRNAVIKERDEARTEAARGDVAKALLSQIDSALKAAGVPTLLTDIGAAERKPMLIRERVEWLTNQWLEAKRQMPEMQKNFDRVLRQRDEARGDRDFYKLEADNLREKVGNALQERNEARAEVEKLKEQLRAEIKKNTITIPIRPEPSRLEIAAMIKAAWGANSAIIRYQIEKNFPDVWTEKEALREADALIAAAKEKQ